jgi:hypothetical protein
MTLAEKIGVEREAAAATTVQPVTTTRPVPAQPTRGRWTRADARRAVATLHSHVSLFRVALGVALVPFVVSALTVLVAGRGYQTSADVALTELNVRDVGQHFVEVGVFSRFGWHHPGPLLFYVLAPVYRVLGSRSFGLLIGALLINAITIVGIGLVARRRAGDGFAIAALASSMLLAQLAGPGVLRSPWTPALVELALVLFLFLAWSLAEADTLLLPWTMLLASWIVQAHLAPTLPVATTLLVGTAIGVRRLRAMYRQDPGAPVVASLRRRLRWAGGVLLVVWFPPLVDVVTHAGGNIGALIDYFLNSRSGTLAEGWRVVANQLSVPPRWLGQNPIPTDLLVHVSAPDGVIPWLGITLVGGIIVAWRRRQSQALHFGLIVAVALVSEIYAVSRINPKPFFAKEKPFAWDVSYLPGTAMLATLASAYVGWKLLERRATWPYLRRTVTVLLLATLAVPAVKLAVSSADAAQIGADGSDVYAAAAPGTLRALGDTNGPVLVRALTPLYPYGHWDLAAMVVLLDQHGIHAVVQPSKHHVGPSSYFGKPVWSLRSYFPSTSIQTTNNFSAVVTIVKLADVFHYHPTRRERLAAVVGRYTTGFARLVHHGPNFAVFVATGTSTRPCAGIWSC